MRNSLPIRAAAFVIILLHSCVFAQKSEIVSEQIGQKLDQYLTRCVPFGFSGAVLAAVDGNIVLNKGYGLADRAKSILNSSETVFPVGSITKQFTAAGILKLEMMGKLNTSDLITKYIKNVPGDKTTITLHNLLTHTSGIIENTGLDFEEVSREEMIKRILIAPLQFKPGTEFGYSNAGYSLLAGIIEIVSEQSYESFLYENLFKPAGMELTGYRRPDWSKKTIAHCYVGERDNGTVLGRPYPHWNYIGNGGILSTTSDMYKWHIALMGESVLSNEAKKKFYTPFLNDYAYGWDNLQTDYGTVIQHDGGSTLGYNAEFRRYIDADVVTLVLSNQFYNTAPLFEAVRDKIELLAFGGSVPIAPPVYPSSDAALQKFTGTYKLPSGSTIEVTIENHALVFRPENEQNAINALFFQEEKNANITSELNAQTKKIFSEFLNNNYLPLKQAIADSNRFNRFVRTWNQGTAEKRTMIDGIITLPSPDVNRKIFLTTVPFQREGINPVPSSSFWLSVLWENNAIIGFEIQPYARASVNSMSFQLWSGETEFAGYHISTARNVRAAFILTPDGKVTSIRFPTQNRDVVAEKVR